MSWPELPPIYPKKPVTEATLLALKEAAEARGWMPEHLLNMTKAMFERAPEALTEREALGLLQYLTPEQK